MTENTKIEWADHTFNPWVGCTKVGPGCDNCYAEGVSTRYKMAEWGAGKPRKRNSVAYWQQPVKWNARAAAAGRRERVFCASLADVFDNEVPQEWRNDLFALIKSTPKLDWLLLTKRIGNVVKMLPADWAGGYPNAWLGATIVNQDEADRDIPKLLATPASIHFLSMEPLLGHVNLTRIEIGGRGALKEPRIMNALEWAPPHGIDWVIAGGESGPHARPMSAEWVRALRDQCKAAEVPFLFKQWGEWHGGMASSDGELVWFIPNSPTAELKAKITADAARDNRRADDTYWSRLHEFGEVCSIDSDEDIPAAYKVGKKLAGRALDGFEHTEFPKAR